MGVLSFLFAASYIGRLLGLASTWTVVFVIGASASATYLVLAPLALSERFRTSILFTNMKRRVIILALVFGPVVAGISYWIYHAGSVEALPVFPYFRSEEHTSELQSLTNLVCRLLLEKKKKNM